jgi:hypothetical protein
MRVGLRSISVGVITTVTLGGTAAGQEPTGSLTLAPAISGSVEQFDGAYQEGVPIVVPAFHDVGPQLSLAYSSAAPSGFAGVGWTLSGANVIERASLGKGAPHYDATDIFLFDGQELVPCQTGSVSPSCTTGGTHSTKIESYVRIKLDSVANTFSHVRTFAFDEVRIAMNRFIVGRSEAAHAGDACSWGGRPHSLPVAAEYNSSVFRRVSCPHPETHGRSVRASFLLRGC